MGIYVIQWDGLPYVKIGKADSLTARLQTFQTGSPLDVIVRGWLLADDDFAKEMELHHRWARLHHRGEWFLSDDEMKAWLETLTIANDWGKPLKANRTGQRAARVAQETAKREAWLATHGKLACPRP